MPSDAIEKSINIILNEIKSLQKQFANEAMQENIEDEFECDKLNYQNDNDENGRTLKLEIVNSFIEGVDPFTGEIFNDNHVLRDPSAMEILIIAQKAIEKRVKYIKNRSSKSGDKWQNSEDEMLISEYKSGMSIKEIAKVHERSNGAILSRLTRHFIEFKEPLDLTNEKLFDTRISNI